VTPLLIAVAKTGGDPGTNWQMVSAIVAMALLGVAILSAAAAWRGAIIAWRGIRGDHERRKADATMKAMFRFLDEHRKLWEVIAQEAAGTGKASRPAGTGRKTSSASPATTSTGSSGRVRDLLRTAKATPARRAHQELLQEIEMIATGCQLNIYSSRVVYDVAHSVIRQIWDLSSLYIQDLRDGTFDARRAQPTAYRHFQRLIDEFDELDGKTPSPPKGQLDTPAEKAKGRPRMSLRGRPGGSRNN
jgi:hypothetical protein